MIELEIIKDSYLRLKNIWKVGQELNISGQTVHSILTKHGLIKRVNYFTEEDKERLKEEYILHKMSNTLDELAQSMGRTKQFICRKAKELGLTDKSSKTWSIDKKPILKEAAKKRISENGHPRGMKGKSHNEEFKQNTSERITKMWKDPNSAFNSEKNRQRLSDNMTKWQSTRESSDNYSRTKIGWFEKEGKLIFMRSSWELNYAHYLNFLIKHNQILSWEYECDTFWFETIKRGVRSYKPDFKIQLPNGTIEYHEVKGWMDKKSITKLKRMAMYYPEIKIKVIDENSFKSIRKLAPMIPNWGIWVEDNPNK